MPVLSHRFQVVSSSGTIGTAGGAAGPLTSGGKLPLSQLQAHASTHAPGGSDALSDYYAPLEFTPQNSVTVAAQTDAALRAAAVAALALTADTIYILIPPGEYELTGTDELDLSAKKIVLVGTTDDPSKHHIFGNISGIAGSAYEYPCLVRLHTSGGLRNVHIQQQSSDLLSGSPGDTVAVGLSDALSHNGVFVNVLLTGRYGRVTVFGAEWAGVYVDVYGTRALLFCNGNLSGFFMRCGSGGENVLIGDNASGTFINCYGGNWSLGAGNMTGRYINCRGGTGSFGGEDGYSVYYTQGTAILDGCTLINGTFPISDPSYSANVRMHQCLQITATDISQNPIQ